MLNLFMMGGPLFMGILTLILLVVIILAVRYAMDSDKSEDRLTTIKSTGKLAMIIGILGQLIGLFDAFKFIEQAGSISPALLAGGLKVSMISTMYGLIIYLVAILICVGLKAKG